MELNRDINVAATAAFVERLLSKKDILREEIRYVDAFSASGIRGLRIAGEIGIHSTMNDWSHEAFELIKENIKINGLEEKAQATRRNANVLLHEQRFHIVDVDPFALLRLTLMRLQVRHTACFRLLLQTQHLSVAHTLTQGSENTHPCH